MKLPNRALYDYELVKYAKRLRIPYFRGVYMRNSLPQSPPHHRECAIVNLDLSTNSGTHWVAYRKNGRLVDYFDSFGNLKPPKELVQYLGKNIKILYNSDRYQNYNQTNCGRLCLDFLYKNK